MTYPGPIQPLSPPNFVQGGGGHVVQPEYNQFGQGVQTLLQAIAARKQNEIQQAILDHGHGGIAESLSRTLHLGA